MESTSSQRGQWYTAANGQFSAGIFHCRHPTAVPVARFGERFTPQASLVRDHSSWWIGLLLFACLILTLEEALHLFYSHPWTDKPKEIALFQDCKWLNAAGTLRDCPVRGYGHMMMACNYDSCLAKEPTTGKRFSQSERQF